MQEIILLVLFFLLVFIAFLGCFIQRFPGPILALIGIVMAKLFTKLGSNLDWINIAIIGVLVVVCYLINKQIPKLAQKLGKYGKPATRGTLLGSIVAFIIVLVMINQGANQYISLALIFCLMISLPFIFATLFEYLSQKDWNTAIVSGRSATVSYFCSTLLKLVTVIYSVYILFAGPGDSAKANSADSSDNSQTEAPADDSSSDSEPADINSLF